MIKTDIYRTFQNLLDTRSYKNYKEAIFNILLVCTGIRSAFLFEESNFQRFDKNPIKKLYKIVKYVNENTSIHIKTTEDNSQFKRIFVYLCESSRKEVNKGLNKEVNKGLNKGLNKVIYPVDLSIMDNENSVNDDDEIALFLGFQCAGHDYSNIEIDRIALNFDIYKGKETISLMAEVCEAEKINIIDLEKYANDLVDKINTIVEEFGYFCDYNLKYWYSTITKIEKLREKDLVFIKDRLNEYLNDLGNFYISDTVLLEKSITYQKFVNIEETMKNKKEYENLLYLYEMMMDGKFDEYYENIKNRDDLYQVAEMLFNFDTEFWKS